MIVLFQVRSLPAFGLLAFGPRVLELDALSRVSEQLRFRDAKHGSSVFGLVHLLVQTVEELLARSWIHESGEDHCVWSSSEPGGEGSRDLGVPGLDALPLGSHSSGPPFCCCSVGREVG
jgi:hypothetical protein